MKHVRAPRKLSLNVEAIRQLRPLNAPELHNVQAGAAGSEEPWCTSETRSGGCTVGL
jgi:hypothetical protein